jgi:hypothetical protein
VKFHLRVVCGLSLALAAIPARADWTVTVLHPSGYLKSQASGGIGNTQVGRAQDSNAHNHAGLWKGTAASFVNLHPATANESYITAMAGTQQVGTASFPTGTHAAAWKGAAATFVDYNPTGADGSNLLGTDGTRQVGFAYFDGAKTATVWFGGPASFAKLAPANADESAAEDVLGTKQVGYAVVNDVSHAAYWQGSAASYISLNPQGSGDCNAMCVDGTRIGGYASFDNMPHAGFWTSTNPQSFVDLHPGGSESYVTDMMGNTQVGYIFSGENRACYWEGTAKSYVDLHQYLPSGYAASVARCVTSDATFIYIIGTAYEVDTEKPVAVVWKRPLSVDFTFTLNKSTVAGLNSVQGTLTLSETQSGATTFTTYDNSSLVATPATVVVPAATLVKNFQITVTAVTSPINTTIYAKLGSAVLSKPLTLAPLVPTALSFTPNPVVGGHPTSCKVVVNGVAGPGGRTIAILDNSAYAVVPSTVVVPAGGTSVTFNITTTHPSTVQNVTVTARVSAGEKTGTFRINP